MSDTKTQQSVRTGFTTREPAYFDVIIHNDDETTMEFVVHILMTIFNKSEEEAEYLMLQVHNDGKGIAGTYFKDMAETKAERARREARDNGFPLQLTVERRYFDLPF